MNLSKYYSPIVLSFSVAALLIACQPDGIATESSLEGTYTVNETATTAGSTTSQKTVFDVHIIKTGTSGDAYRVENFYNLGFSNSINISKSGNDISIPSQRISGFTLSGSGTISGTTLSLSYRAVDAASVTDNCTATATKQ
jgi:hypothetical protein